MKVGKQLKKNNPISIVLTHPTKVKLQIMFNLSNLTYFKVFMLQNCMV